jgi:hypothetical protein
MAENIDDLTIEYKEEEKLIVKQIDKVILTRGSWTTIMFLFQELDKNTEQFGPERVSIRRYQKRGGVYRQQSKFNISSPKQGREIAGVLYKWYPTDPKADAKAAEDKED